MEEVKKDEIIEQKEEHQQDNTLIEKIESLEKEISLKLDTLTNVLTEYLEKVSKKEDGEDGEDGEDEEVDFDF